MTTLITRETETFYTLNTAKGKEIGVSFGLSNMVRIYIKRNGMSELAMGRNFSSLSDAIEAYKSADIKAALYALMEA
jgi:ABC-type nitrate/sulfonate/bicarbonate transport system substrate-binding protein